MFYVKSSKVAKTEGRRNFSDDASWARPVSLAKKFKSPALFSKDKFYVSVCVSTAKHMKKHKTWRRT